MLLKNADTAMSPRESVLPPLIDDVGAPGRTTVSLLRTFIGAHLRQIGGWIAVSDLVLLMAGVGSSSTVTRSAISRVKTKGLLVPEQVGGRAGYRLAPEAAPMLSRGDRRIFGQPPMRLGDPWMVLVFSVPEDARHLRHRLRTQLTWLGCGVVAPGTWIGPGHLLDETLTVLREHRLAEYVTAFTTTTPVTPVPLAEAVRAWWDLDALRGRYERLLDVHRCVVTSWQQDGGTDERAFADHLRLLDDWRGIPYLDPGPPAELLPPAWPGHEGMALFDLLHDRLEPAARRHVRAVTGSAGTPDPSPGRAAAK